MLGYPYELGTGYVQCCAPLCYISYVQVAHAFIINTSNCYYPQLSCSHRTQHSQLCAPSDVSRPCIIFHKQGARNHQHARCDVVGRTCNEHVDSFCWICLGGDDSTNSNALRAAQIYVKVDAAGHAARCTCARHRRVGPRLPNPLRGEN